MTKFGDWILEWNPTEPHKLWNVYGDLATLTAQLEETLESIAVLPDTCRRPDCKECAALKACKEFMDRHE